MNADRQYAVASLLFEYMKSPSLRHLRDAHSVHRLAQEIVSALDRASSVWSKWEADREEMAKAAAECWIPTEDLRISLNSLPSPLLTKTDVEQRLRAIWEEPYTSYPNEELKEGCLKLYHSERSQGTEMRAIIGMLQEKPRARRRTAPARAGGEISQTERTGASKTRTTLSLRS